MVSQKTTAETKSSRVIINLSPGSSTLVILFGWAGCHDRYLKKYSDYYEKAGSHLPPIRVQQLLFAQISQDIESVPSTCEEFFREVSRRKRAQHLLQILFPILFFSMNGCSTFTTFWDLLDKKPNGDSFKQRVQGILFDSFFKLSPAFTTPSQSANAISFASMPPSKYHAVFRESYRAILYAYFSLHQ
ncbi:hypothetical protein OSTOST_15698 [Ostertagia ostertagi]